MFTGIVECTGKLLECRAIDGGARFRIALPFAAELQPGDSVAVNGCCLTVDELGDGYACFDLLQQTLRVTSLGDLTVGSLCNLERAMLPTTRLGGHFVSGHIDAAGTLLGVSAVGQDHVLRVQAPDLRYVIDKGSIAIDGVSLTIAAIHRDNRELEFWITPHTWQTTVMPHYRPRMRVNVEWDVLAKYAESFLLPKD